MKHVTALLMLVLLAGYVQAAPVTTAVVKRPTTTATVNHPTTTAIVNRPTTTAVVSRPTTVVPVLRPATTAVVTHPVTTATVSHPTTQVAVTHPGERGVSYVPTPAPAPAPTSAPKAESSASKPTSSSSVGSYTPSYKNAKDLKAKDVPQAADMLKAASGLGMTNSNSAQKEADAKSFKVEKGLSTQVSEEDVLKNTKLPSNLDSILKQRNFEEAKSAGKK